MTISIIALLTIFIALAGGLQFYWSPLAGAVCTLLGLVAVPRAAWLWRAGHRPPVFWPLAVLLAPMMVSALAHPDIWPVTLSRILLFIVALAVMVIAAAQNPVDLQAGLWWAGLAWPVVWVVLALAGYHQYQRNIIAVWPLVFCLVGLRTGTGWYVALHLFWLAWFGSRGAVIGLGGGLWILYFYRRATPQWVIGLVCLVITGLVAARWGTTLARLHYWQYALAAWLNSPLVGVGPGGIKALQLIPEFHGNPGEYTIHAHNIFITYLTETGLVGLVALIISGGWFYVSRFTFSRWQLAIITALALHSLVDEPLWWPGPLVLAAAIAGARRDIWTFIPPGWRRYQPETSII